MAITSKPSPDGGKRTGRPAGGDNAAPNNTKYPRGTPLSGGKSTLGSYNPPSYRMPDKNVTSGIAKGTATLVNSARIISGVKTGSGGGGGGGSGGGGGGGSGGGGGGRGSGSGAVATPPPPPNLKVQSYSTATQSGSGDVIKNAAYKAPAYKPLVQKTITDTPENVKAPTGTKSVYDTADMTIYTPTKAAPVATPVKAPVGGYSMGSLERPSLQAGPMEEASVYKPPSPVPVRPVLGTHPTKSVGGYGTQPVGGQPQRTYGVGNFASMAKAPLQGPPRMKTHHGPPLMHAAPGGGGTIGAQAMQASGAAARGPARSYRAGRGFGR
jgi:hypothetical protein